MKWSSPRLDLLIQTLSDEGVRYVLVGGFAVAYHGGDWTTTDVDLAVAPDPSTREALARALNRLRPTMRGHPITLDAQAFGGAFVRYETEAGTLDILNRLTIPFEELSRNSVAANLFGCQVHIASIEDLLALKELSERPKDQLHAIFLRDLISAKKENLP